MDKSNQIQQLQQELDIYKKKLAAKETQSRRREPAPLASDVPADPNGHRLYSRLLLEACPAILMAFDEEMRYVLGTGRQAAKAFGFADAQALSGLTVAAMLQNATASGWAQRIDAACRQVLETGKASGFTDEMPRLDGGLRHVNVTIVPAVDEEGEKRGFILQLFDITELVGAREEAQAASRVKGGFLASMSHEIRTPMNAVIGMANLLSRTPLDAGQQGYVQNILGAAESLVNLINDILDFSKIDAQELTLKSQPYSLAEMLRDVVNMVGLRAAQKGLTLVTDIDPELPAQLIGDVLRLKQVLVNLLANAIRNTDAGTITLAVGGERDGESLRLLVRVTDTGTGIDPQALPLLFTAFAREGGKKGAMLGNGLDLAVSKGIVEAMHGTIDVRSELGKGSEFTVRVEQRVHAQAKVCAVREPAAKRVLIYGEGPVCQALARKLARLYLRTDVADTPQAFCELLEHNKYSHIFYWENTLDEACARALSFRPDTSCIAVQPLPASDEEATRMRPENALPEPLLIFDVADILNLEARYAYAGRPAGEHALGGFKTVDVRALVVDDNEINLLVAVEMLALYGIALDTAMDGQEAVERCRESVYDIIFMDHMMPGMDGVEATGIIRTLSAHYAKAPIIALTANAVVGAREQLLRNQMSDFLSKPIEIDELNRVLKQWLAPHKLVAEEATPDADAGAQAEPLASDLLSRVKASGLLEVSDALRRVGGLERTYESVLRTFFINAPRKEQTLSDAWSGKDWDRYRIEVHGCKSALNTIGAYSLAEAARKLELSAINGDTGYILEKGPGFLQALRALSEAVGPLLREQTPTPARAQATESERAALHGALWTVRNLLDCLESAQAEQTIQALMQASYGELDGALQTILTSIEGFDYDTAIQQIEAILAAQS